MRRTQCKGNWAAGLLCILTFFYFSTTTFAQVNSADTVKTGIYITSIHDIDFKEKEYTINFWLWLKYKNREFNFLENLEIPQAKTITKSFSTIDSSNGEYYILMKILCVMKNSWKIDNFPFDKQKLRISIENSQFDSQSLIFKVDTFGKYFDPRFTLRGWTIGKSDISIGVKKYETGFGDPEITEPHSEYSAFKVKVEINREAMGLFWKMFFGMYVSFLIAYVCCFIHSDSMDSRFSLTVGALFAVVGNKYIVETSLPESISLTLVDTLHGITLLAILLIIISTTIHLKFIKEKKTLFAQKFDRYSAQVILILYLILNIYFIKFANDMQ